MGHLAGWDSSLMPLLVDRTFKYAGGTLLEEVYYVNVRGYGCCGINCHVIAGYPQLADGPSATASRTG